MYTSSTMTINILPQQVSDQIAAGEVVERPASVVKELIENSLDAGANHIEVFIDDGGRSRICIVDNGNGMSPEDAQKCVLRHATSKISTIDDLFSVSSFGFRGEALAAISSVSKCRVTTKRSTDKEGYTFLVEGGKTIENDIVASTDGTSIDVRDLFYVTPARLQYLKADSTEYRHIVHEIQCFALSNPEVSFVLTKDGKESLRYPVAHANQRIAQVLNMKTEDFVSVEHTVSTMKVTGIIGKPEHAQRNKSNQFLFVNGRPIEDFRIAHSIRETYMRSCGIDKALHPFFVLFLEIDPLLVDVNVHPRKREVKFSDPQDIYGFFRAMTKKSLQGYTQMSPSVTPYTNTSFQTNTSPKQSFSAPLFSNTPTNRQKESGALLNQSVSFGDRYTQEASVSENMNTYENDDALSIPNDIQVVGQMARKYIVAESGSGMYIFDQHALHERLRFNRLLKQAQSKEVEIQSLLVPQSFPMSAPEILLLQEQKQVLADLGITFEVQDQTIELKAIPSVLQQESFEHLFQDFVRYFEDESISEHSYDRILRVVLEYKSCRGSVFFGDKMEIPEMQQLVDEFIVGDWKLLCPHGRPNHVFWPFEDIDKGFMR